MKLHVGCGSVYLREWVNLDLPLPWVYLAKERRDLVDRYVTEESAYYGRHNDKTAETLRSGPLTQETVCDAYGSFGFLPVRPGTVTEILSRQCFEHLSPLDAREAVCQCHRALKPGGHLRIDIPDPDETLRQYVKTADEFYIRHLFGPRRDVYGFHTHYTRAMLKSLVEEKGFWFVEEEANPHFYPAFTLRFQKCV